MLVRVIIGLALGALVGSAIGATRTCSTGGCPLTATPKRAALWGSILGILLALSLPSGVTLSTDPGGARPEAVQQIRGSIQPLETVEDFDRDVLGRAGKSLVVFEAAWCGSCRTYKPIVDRTAKRFSGEVAFFQVDVDAARDLARRFRIEMLPTTVIVADGKIQHGFVGIASEEKLAQILTGPAES